MKTTGSLSEKPNELPSSRNEVDKARGGAPRLNTHLAKEALGDEKTPSLESPRSPDFDNSEKGDDSPRSDFSEHRVPLTRAVSEVYDGIESRRDVEIGSEALEKSTTEHTQADPNLVTWEGDNDTDNPKNWPKRKKWAAVVCVSSFTLISPVASSMIAPALEAIGRELDIPSAMERALSLSIFVLAYAIGPLFVSRLSSCHLSFVIRPTCLLTLPTRSYISSIQSSRPREVQNSNIQLDRPYVRTTWKSHSAPAQQSRLSVLQPRLRAGPDKRPNDRVSFPCRLRRLGASSHRRRRVSRPLHS